MVPRITRASIQEVVDKIDAIAVVSDYVRLENRSGRYVGLCPFHNEKTPSFTVNPDLKLYYCFGCGKGGTVLSFIMEQDKLTFPEAVETLAKRFGVAIVYEQGENGPSTQEESKTADLFELYTRVVGSFHFWLTQKPAGKRALDYILSRGISMEMVEKFRLGYAPTDRRWLHSFLSKKGYSDEFLASSMLFSRKYPASSFFSDRLMFPIADRQGRTVAFGGRLLPDNPPDNAPSRSPNGNPPNSTSPNSSGGEGPKYINTPETAIYKKGQTLFGIDLALPEIKNAKAALLAEGNVDVIALHQAGIANAVAPLGTAFTDEQARLLRRFADRVIIMFDADSAGQTAAVKAILTARRNGLEAAVVVPDEKNSVIKMKDPADILKEFGAEALTNCVKSVIIDIDYLVARSKALFDVNSGGNSAGTSSEGKSKAVAFLFPYLETLDSDISKDEAMGQLADAFGVDREAVRNDYLRRNSPANKFGSNQFSAGRYSNTQAHAARSQNASPIRLNDELFLLAVVSVNDNLYPQFRARISIKEIEDPSAKDLFIALEDCFVHDETGMDALLARISSDDVRKFIIERGTSAEFSSNPEQLISDGIKRIKQKRIERRLAKIVTELRLAKGEDVEELLLEKTHIDAELHRLKEEKWQK
jgi:DNA primase